MSRSTQEQLEGSLLLRDFLLAAFGFESFQDISDLLGEQALEGEASDGQSKFASEYQLHLPKTGRIQVETLLRYDRNVIDYSKSLSRARGGSPIVWKYFQWCALMVSEYFLDRYFDNPAQLVKEIDAFRISSEAYAGLGPMQSEDLSKVAFWMATGAGKTLLLHANILQYRYWAEQHAAPQPDRVLLVTPNEALSRQHVDELSLSGIAAGLFEKDRSDLFSRHTVDVVDIHKLREESGDKTIAVESLEGNNLVLVDEGHRGATGDEWMRSRRALGRAGFTIEYSATFGQVARTPASQEDYGKSILFDYPYARFHGDGYGKDYRILNVSGVPDENTRQQYLLGGLLTFLEQMTAWAGDPAVTAKHRLARPLMVFVGSTVARSSKTERSDVLDVLAFFRRVLNERSWSLSSLESLFEGTALLSSDGQPVFRDGWPLLRSDESASPEGVYARLLSLFRTDTPSDLLVTQLGVASGELLLSVAGGDPFGLIVVGDSSKLLSACADAGIPTDVRELGTPEFDNVDNEDSQYNFLLGARKFNEGWNSWRVSSIGLLNVGRSEGPQVVQIFGRGVRLRGKNGSLRRSQFVNGATASKSVRAVETLNVFGVRATYLEQFQKHLQAAGVVDMRSASEHRVLTELRIPDGLSLKYPTTPLELDFPSGPIVRLSPTQPENLVSLNWYPRVSALGFSEAPHDELENGELQPSHLDYVDWSRVIEELRRLIGQRGWSNFDFDHATLRELMEDPRWYVLRIPADQLEHRTGRPRMWTDIATSLLRGAAEKQYRRERQAWESSHASVDTVREDGPNMVSEYVFLRTMKSPDNWVERLAHAVAAYEGKSTTETELGLTLHDIPSHLYSPLVAYKKGHQLNVVPTALNIGERQFVMDFTAAVGNQSTKGPVSIHILRNQSRGRGVGFFEAGNYFPDFMIWAVDGEKQHLMFVDPKGLRQVSGIDDPKIELHTKILDVEKALGDPDLRLSAFIVSVTDLSNISWAGSYSVKDFRDRNVLFQSSPEYADELVVALLARLA